MLQPATFLPILHKSLIEWWGKSNQPEGLRHIFAPARALLLDGKGLRPYIYACAAGDRYHDKVALAWEILHLFALVHDDVMDHADVRRNFPTVHAALRSRYPRTHTSQAIMVGDWLLAESYLLITDSTIKNSEEIRNIFHDTVIHLSYGQMYDIALSEEKAHVTREQIHQKNIKKTAQYSFVGPWLMGAIHGYPDITAGEKKWISEVGTDIGIWFQTQDDLLDLLPQELTKKPQYNDLYEGQWTMVRWHLEQQVSVNEWQFLTSIVGQERTSQSLDRIREILTSYGIQKQVEAENAMLYDKIMADIALAPRSAFSEFAMNIITILNNRKK